MLLAIDIAILPPVAVSQCAIELSARLPPAEFQGLRLGSDCLPHITLTQQFITTQSLEAVLAAVDAVFRQTDALPLRVAGGGKGSNSVWLRIERTPELDGLHERLLQAVEPFEVETGDAAAFFGGNARERDVGWVREFRRESSLERFTPHITLGHALSPPDADPMEFVATRVAVCQLGRFCTCPRILRQWELQTPNSP